MTFSRRVFLSVVLSIVTGFALFVPSASAAGAEADCTTQGYREIRPGVFIQDFDNTDVTGAIAGLPDRITTDIGPGESGQVCVGFHNRTGDPLELKFAVHDVGAARDGAPIPFAAGDETFGAGRWLRLPTDEPVRLQHGELVWLAIDVDVPADASGGSAYAGVSASVPDAIDSSTEGNQAKITPAVVVQIFFDVPGDITESGRVTSVRSPRVIWWDGLGVGDVPVLDKLRGQGIAPVRFKWKNDGSITDAIKGTVTIESALGGKDVAKLEIPERVVLRDASRPFEVTWSKDIPFIGKFNPTLEITRANGEVVKRELPAIWVIPAWWYLLLLVIAIAIPVWMRRRSKRKYHDLVARVEAAEARAAEPGDEEWDDQSDEWS